MTDIVDAKDIFSAKKSKNDSSRLMNDIASNLNLLADKMEELAEYLKPSTEEKIDDEKK